MKTISLLRLQARSWYRLMLLFYAIVLGAMQVLATDVSTTSFSATSGNIGNDANITYACSQDGGTNAPEMNGSYLKLYRYNKKNNGYGNYVEIVPNNNCTITSITVNFSKNNDANTGVAYAYKIDNASAVTVTTASKTFSATNISATSSIKFWNYSIEQMQVMSIYVTYNSSTPTPSCSNKITLTKVAPTNGSFFVSH